MAGGQLLWMLAEHLVLTGLPGIAAILLAARGGVRSAPLLLAIGLAVSGALAMLAFWAYFADPVVGEAFSYFVLFGALAAVVWTALGGGLERAVLRPLLTPLALWVLGSFFLVFLGFVHGDTDQPLGTAVIRFIGPLTSDATIPFYYAEWLFDHGRAGDVPVYPGEWHSSDRPPLQVGYVVAQRPFAWGDKELHYEVLGVVLQQLWIVGLWALLLAARVGRLTRALAMATVLVSPLVFVNGFFVWPKLLPAAMLLAIAALVATPLWPQLRRSPWGAALIAALAALAMLGHGSSVFGLIPLAALAAYRGLPSWRWLGIAVAVGIALMAPWSAYQKYEDPPGNRLTKWMLAGSPEIDERGTLATIVDSYRDDGFGAALHNKGQNLVTIAGGGPAAESFADAFEAARDGNWEGAVGGLRVIFFFYLLPSLGLLLLGPVAMAIGWRRGRGRGEEWRFALTCLAILAIGALAWALLLYGNLVSRTVIHAGSFLLPILGLCGAVAGLRAVAPRFAVYYVALSAVLMLALYAPVLEPLPGTSYSPLAIAVAAAGLLGFLGFALRGPEPEPEPPAPTAPRRSAAPRG